MNWVRIGIFSIGSIIGISGIFWGILHLPGAWAGIVLIGGLIFMIFSLFGIINACDPISRNNNESKVIIALVPPV